MDRHQETNAAIISPVAKVKTNGEWSIWQDQRYHFFGCLSGTLSWSCPHCGQVQSNRIGKRQWHLQCRASDCRRKIIFCFTLRHVEKNRKLDVLPRDMMLELAPVPTTRPLGFGPQAPVHKMMPQDAVEAE